MQYIKNCLTQDAFWQINKRLVIELGIESAVVLTDLIEKYYNFQGRSATLFRNDRHWFFYTSTSIEETFSIGYRVQKRILADLTARGLIMTKLFGSPAKLHITICEKPIALMLNSSFAKTAKLDLPKQQNQFDQNGKTIINNTNNNISLPNGNEGKDKISEEKSKKFIVPTIEAVKEYFIALGFPAETDRFFDFYTSKGWLVGKNKMKDWKAAARNWTRGVEKEQPKEEQKQKISL